MIGHRACDSGFEAHSIGNDGNLNASVTRKVGDRAVIYNVAVEYEGLAVTDPCVKDIRRILDALVFIKGLFAPLLVLL